MVNDVIDLVSLTVVCVNSAYMIVANRKVQVSSAGLNNIDPIGSPDDVYCLEIGINDLARTPQIVKTTVPPSARRNFVPV